MSDPNPTTDPIDPPTAGKGAVRKPVAPGDSALDYEGRSEQITQRIRVVALLKRLHQERTLLSVRVGEDPRVFNSMILEVEGDAGYFVLDELNPREGHERLLETGRLQAHSQCQGIRLSFTTTAVVETDDRGLASYRCPLPERMVYMQRRAAFRVPVGVGHAVRVQLPVEDGKVVEGQLCDLSLRGVGLRLDTREPLRTGLRIPECRLLLPDGTEICTGIEIRHGHYDEAHGHLRAGACFTGLDPQQHKQLRCFVTQLQREMLRKRLR